MKERECERMTELEIKSESETETERLQAYAYNILNPRMSENET